MFFVWFFFRFAFGCTIKHFHYVYIICFKIGVRTDKSYVLTDPCILTNKAGKFGTTDCGRDYILNFFANHKCNSFCESHWKRPEQSQMSQNVRAVRRTSYAFETREFQSRRNINKEKESVFNASAVLAQLKTIGEE